MWLVQTEDTPAITRGEYHKTLASSRRTNVDTANLVLRQLCHPRPCLLCGRPSHSEDPLELVVNVTAREQVLTSIGQLWRKMIGWMSCDHHMTTVESDAVR